MGSNVPELFAPGNSHPRRGHTSSLRQRMSAKNSNGSALKQAWSVKSCSSWRNKLLVSSYFESHSPPTVFCASGSIHHQAHRVGGAGSSAEGGVSVAPDGARERCLGVTFRHPHCRRGFRRVCIACSRGTCT